MKIQTEDNTSVQLTEISNFSPDGILLSKSLNLTLRNESVGKVWKTYQELKKLIEGKENKPEKKVKNNPGKEKKENKKEQKNNNSDNICPKCGAVLVHRSGISRNGVAYNFLGCSSFPICSYTRNIPEKESLPIADQDLINVEEVPF